MINAVLVGRVAGRPPVRQFGRGVAAANEGGDLRGLLGELGALEEVLDVLLLPLALVNVAPPLRPLVFAGAPEVFARFAEAPLLHIPANIVERVILGLGRGVHAEFFKSLGLNCIRIAINYRHFEDDDKPRVLKPEGLKHLDRVINACAQHGIYTIIDLHTVPGGQNGGKSRFSPDR